MRAGAELRPPFGGKGGAAHRAKVEAAVVARRPGRAAGSRRAWFATDFAGGGSNGEGQISFIESMDFVNEAKAAGRTIPGFPYAHPEDLGARGIDKPFSLHQSITDIPAGNVDVMSVDVLRLAGLRNIDIRTAVADPGVGNRKGANGHGSTGSHARSILVTDNHGVTVSPNNGIHALLIEALKAAGEPYELLEIDFDKARTFASLVLGIPKDELPPSFHGRDLFPFVSGGIAAGISPWAFAVEGTLKPEYATFAGKLTPLERLPNGLVVAGVRDNTRGNVKFSTHGTGDTFRNSIHGKVFGVRGPGMTEEIPVPGVDVFKDVPDGAPGLMLGSTFFGVNRQGPRFAELFVNNADASELFQVPAENAASEIHVRELVDVDPAHL